VSSFLRAAADFDLSGPQAVLTHWHALATMAVLVLFHQQRKGLVHLKIPM